MEEREKGGEEVRIKISYVMFTVLHDESNNYVLKTYTNKKIFKVTLKD